MGGDYSPAVAAIGAACLIAMALLITRGDRHNRSRVTSSKEDKR